MASLQVSSKTGSRASSTNPIGLRPPYLVFITEKGRDIRFLGPASPPNGEIMWDLIQSGRWQQWIPYEGLGFL
jgi:hypothetical protein